MKDGPAQVTPEQLIADTVSTLRNDDEVDGDVLNILASSIVTLNPAETAVIDAVRALEDLAAKRTESLDNGCTHHD
jgi:hypothetical protein